MTPYGLPGLVPCPADLAPSHYHLTGMRIHRGTVDCMQLLTLHLVLPRSNLLLFPATNKGELKKKS